MKRLVPFAGKERHGNAFGPHSPSKRPAVLQRRGGNSPDHAARVRRWFLSGMDTAEIAADLGTTEWHVVKLLDMARAASGRQDADPGELFGGQA